jgi:L-seryl-tRNA(Ser) seleniumtransferase
LLLRVHPSNYRIRGFVEKPELRDMVALARRHQIPLVEDIGSGCLVDLGPYGISDEPIAGQSIAAGVDVLCFSGDKLLGGPQAGIVAGACKWIEPIRTNPLMRTYRVEKLIYGALEATLASYRAGRALEEIPVLRMIRCSREEMEDRARRFAGSLEGRLPRQCRISLLNGNSVVGGGSCPDTQMPTRLVAIQCDTTTPNTVEQRLRRQRPPIVVRLEANQTLLDLRTVFPTQESTLLEGIIAAYRED